MVVLDKKDRIMTKYQLGQDEIWPWYSLEPENTYSRDFDVEVSDEEFALYNQALSVVFDFQNKWEKEAEKREYDRKFPPITWLEKENKMQDTTMLVKDRLYLVDNHVWKAYDDITVWEAKTRHNFKEIRRVNLKLRKELNRLNIGDL
jgi:hypothetical protein